MILDANGDRPSAGLPNLEKDVSSTEIRLIEIDDPQNRNFSSCDRFNGLFIIDQSYSPSLESGPKMVAFAILRAFARSYFIPTLKYSHKS